MWRRLLINGACAGRSRAQTFHQLHSYSNNPPQWQHALHSGGGGGGDGTYQYYGELAAQDGIGAGGQPMGYYPHDGPGGVPQGSVGPGGAADSPASPHDVSAPRATVLVNGTLALSCCLPSEGTACSESVEVSPELNIMGDVGGLTLDVLFTTTCIPDSQPDPGRWVGHLIARCGAAERYVTLGTVGTAASDRSSHLATFLDAPEVSSFRIEITAVQQDAESVPKPPAEERLVVDILNILHDRQVNTHGGSLASVLVNNKAKQGPLYEAVIGGRYSGCWLEFVRAHPDDLAVFRYTDRDVRERNLAPLAKPGDARISVAFADRTSVADADAAHAAQLREQEVGIRDFLVGALSDGELDQAQLIDRLRECPDFCRLVAPSAPLLQRFLARHGDQFVWSSAPDMPTRIGLAGESRFPHRTRFSDFAQLTLPPSPKARTQPQQRRASQAQRVSSHSSVPAADLPPPAWRDQPAPPPPPSPSPAPYSWDAVAADVPQWPGYHAPLQLDRSYSWSSAPLDDSYYPVAPTMSFSSMGSGLRGEAWDTAAPPAFTAVQQRTPKFIRHDPYGVEQSCCPAEPATWKDTSASIAGAE
eukprot:TRINITY_DN11455_c0_g1_i1.p1 TRINITY_DN11455_c0_g1~~TRINITY_DN11455_c0_g1_i1.p1  ORF type:complete len:626 (+),score=180.73 TRINITY_DN11455_c0_g1_i1:117-1880(+)